MHARSALLLFARVASITGAEGAAAGQRGAAEVHAELQRVERRLLAHQRALVELLRGEAAGAEAAAAALRAAVPSESCPAATGASAVRGSGWNRSYSVALSGDSPRLLSVDGFLTDEECDYLIELGEPMLTDSVVVGADDGAGLRKSRSAFLNGRGAPTKLREDKVLNRVLKRIQAWSGFSTEYFEPIQMGSYVPGDFYGFHKDSDSQVGRTATFLAYLADTEEGGETIFPALSRPNTRFGLDELNWGKKDQPAMGPYCTNPSVFKVKPKKGRAILFFNHRPDLQACPFALHGSCPVVQGRKVVIQQWIRFWTDKKGNVFYNKHIKGKEQFN